MLRSGILSFNFCVVEILPIFKVVEIYSVKDRAGIGDANRLENGGAGCVIMVVTNNSSVVCIDRLIVEGASFLVEDPLFTLGVRRLIFFDVG